MRKLFSLSVFTVLTLALVACGGKKDVENPVVDITSGMLPTSGNQYTLTGTATDDVDVDVLQFNVKDAGGEFTQENKVITDSLKSNGDFSYTITLDEGVNVITVYAFDKEENKASDSVTVTYTAPVEPLN